MRDAPRGPEGQPRAAVPRRATDIAFKTSAPSPDCYKVIKQKKGLLTLIFFFQKSLLGIYELELDNRDIYF